MATGQVKIKEMDRVHSPFKLTKEQTMEVFMYVIEMKKVALKALQEAEDIRYEY
jgi:hypothetical protein